MVREESSLLIQCVERTTHVMFTKTIDLSDRNVLVENDDFFTVIHLIEHVGDYDVFLLIDSLPVSRMTFC